MSIWKYSDVLVPLLSATGKGQMVHLRFLTRWKQQSGGKLESGWWGKWPKWLHSIWCSLDYNVPETLSMMLGVICKVPKSKHRMSVTGPLRPSVLQVWSSHGWHKFWESMLQHPAHPPLGSRSKGRNCHWIRTTVTATSSWLSLWS